MRKLNRLADRVLDRFIARTTASAACKWVSSGCPAGAMRRCCTTDGHTTCSPCALP